MVEYEFELRQKVLHILVLGIPAAAQADGTEVINEMLDDMKTVSTDGGSSEICMGNVFIYVIKIDRDISDIAQFASIGLIVQGLISYIAKVGYQIIFLSVRKDIDDRTVFEIHQDTDIK